MAKRATRDEILDQTEQTAELVRRANDSLDRPDGGFSREEAVARARAAVDVVRARKAVWIELG